MHTSHRIIGGEDYRFEELCGWPTVLLARLIVRYQDVRRTWHSADAAVARYVAALEAELNAVRNELDAAQRELLQLRRGAEAIRQAAPVSRTGARLRAGALAR